MPLNNTFSTIILTVVFLFITNISLASPSGHSETLDATKSHPPMKGHHDKMGHHKSKTGKKSHHGTFTPHWAKTLSDQQKHQVDQMHVTVTKQHAVLKAQKALKKAELENLMVKDQYDKTTAYSLIDEMAKIKAQLLKVRYDHVAEMRAILTENQRLSYDMDRFKEKKHGK